VTTYVALLRGVNLASRNRVSMAELRELLESAGLDGVRTYLQSGNVVLRSTARPEAVARECERQIAKGFGLDIAVVVRTQAQLAAVVRRNPLEKVATEPKRYLVSFLAAKPDPAAVERIAAAAVAPERLVAHGRELYAWLPEGVGRSKLWSRLADARLGTVATARNWSTVTSLLELAAAT
jgi:uncharacterized protein (DUF1697 family)